MLSDEPKPVELGELAAHSLGDDGTVLGVELTTATLASSALAVALALALGELHLSLCIVAGSGAVTDGGVTDGGVSGERRFIGQVGVVAGIRGAGNEMKVGACSSETAANFEEVVLPSEERLLLFETMTLIVDTGYDRIQVRLFFLLFFFLSRELSSDSVVEVRFSVKQGGRR